MVLLQQMDDIPLKVIEMSGDKAESPLVKEPQEAPSIRGHVEPETEKSSLVENEPKDRKKLGYRHQLSVITISRSKTSPKPQKEGNTDEQTEGGEKTVEPTQVPLEFEEGSSHRRRATRGQSWFE